jgi:CRISPR-associated protein Cas2
VAERLRYLVAYDIREPRRLRRVHSVVKDYGYPLQYSVFVCDLTAMELIAMKSDLTAEAHLAEDSIAIFDLGQPSGRGVECIEFLGARRNLERSDEPTIW